MLVVHRIICRIEKLEFECGEGKIMSPPSLVSPLPHRESGSSAVGLHGLDQLSVLLGAGDNGGEGVVLGSGTKHGGAADVDVLDTLLKGGALGNSRLEGVEVEDRDVDDANVVVNHVLRGVKEPLE